MVHEDTCRALTVVYVLLPVLFQIDVGDIDRGACLSFLSQYPNEDEILIPPLSYLEVVDEPFFTPTAKGDVKVPCCMVFRGVCRASCVWVCWLALIHASALL